MSSPFSRRCLSAAIAVLLVLAGWPALAGGISFMARANGDEGTITPPPSIEPLSHNPETFRLQLLDYLHDMEDALSLALAHPGIGERLAPVLGGMELPLPPEAYAALNDASAEELWKIRDAVAQVPNFRAAPAVLVDSIQLLAAAQEQSQAGTCSTNIQEFLAIVSSTDTIDILNRTKNILDIVRSVTNTVFEALRAGLEDVPIIGSKPAIPGAVIAGVADLASRALGFAADEIGFLVQNSELCIADCLLDTAPTLRGKGCDNRNNDCGSLWFTDERDEDRFKPELFIDSTLVSRCFPKFSEANEAVKLSVEARDDCTEFDSPSTSDGAVSAVLSPPANCKSSLSVTAQDASGGTTAISLIQQITIDDAPPSIQFSGPPLFVAPACYADLAGARAAFDAAVNILDCTDFNETTRVEEQDCVANFKVEAVDECGNRSSASASVRVDGSPPVVDIEKLMLPAVDGLSCFKSEAVATATLLEATTVSDNCSAKAKLPLVVSATGDLCNREITFGATDECGLSGSDSLIVRVDDEPPSVSCSTVTDLLWPANNALTDVGLSIAAGDNCDGNQPRIDLEITSDEATGLAFLAPPNDPAPDAVIERLADGTIQRVLLRAQRRGPQGYPNQNGRVYRMRVTATDSCGLSSYVDCFVSVPSTYSVYSGDGTITNDGQMFDATRFN